MPFNITLSPSPQFSSSTQNASQFQDWEFSPADSISVEHVIGEANPSSIVLDTVIKDFYNLDLNLDSIYYVKIEQVLASVNGNLIELLNITGPIVSAGATGYQLDGSNNAVQHTLQWKNLELVPEGNYTTGLKFLVTKADAQGNVEFVESRTVVVSLNVSVATSITATPQRIISGHIIDDALPASEDVIVNVGGSGVDFTILVPSFYTPTGLNISYLNDEQGGSFKLYSATGNQTITLTPNTGFNNLQIGVNNSRIEYRLGNQIIFSTIKIYAFSENNAIINPQSIEFEAIKGFSQAIPVGLGITAPGAITITLPVWLQATLTQDDFHLRTVLTPILAENLSAGVYQEDIIINANGLIYTVPVTYTIREAISLGMSQSKINFTDDFSTITKCFINPEYKVKVKLLASWYKHRQIAAIEKPLNYTYGVFDNKVDFFIGKTLNNLMAELKNLDVIDLNDLLSIQPDQFINYYKPANVDLEINLEHSVDELLNTDFIFEGIKFLKGRKPKGDLESTEQLSFYRSPLRVTPNSITIFNFYKTESHNLRIYKNDELETIIGHDVNDALAFGFIKSFESYAPGDVVEIRLYKAEDLNITESWYEDNNNYLAQKYLVFPTGKRSYHVAWQTEHETVEVLEFTGDIGFQMNYEKKLVKDYKEFRETLRKIDSRREQNVVINTGFILSENTNQLDGLLDANRAWLLKSGEAPLELIPNKKSMTNFDSDEDLYEFDIEFIINLNNENRINS